MISIDLKQSPQILHATVFLTYFKYIELIKDLYLIAIINENAPSIRIFTTNAVHKVPKSRNNELNDIAKAINEIEYINTQ